MASIYQVMDEDQKFQANALGFGNFFKGVSGRRRKKRLFAALDKGREGLREIRVNPDDAAAVASLAGAYATKLNLVGFLRERKTEALSNPKQRRQIVEAFGAYAAEKYFRDRKVHAEHEASLLGIAVSDEEMRELISSMVTAGQLPVDSGVEVPEGELDVDEAVELLVSALGRYESAIPEVNEDGSVPETVQDVGIANAAFFKLTAKELQRLADAPQDDGVAEAKPALARRLAEKYAGREEEIARLVLGTPSGERELTGLTTRLMPLAEAPTDLPDIADRLKALRGRYFETRPAEWFCFREVTYSGAALTLTGEIFGYNVHVGEVKDEARLQPHRQRESVRVTLRRGVAWAETDARRASALTAVRRVLIRTELARPLHTVAAPDDLVDAPYSRCDARTLWILELLSRELSQDPFAVLDHQMVNFERTAGDTKPAQVAPGQSRSRVSEVRLKGTLLMDHPEICALILRKRRIIDIELTLGIMRAGVNRQFWPKMRIRFSWANDHVALTSGDIDGSFDAQVHGQLVSMVRSAVPRAITQENVEFSLKTILGNALRTEGDDLDSVVQAVAAAGN